MNAAAFDPLADLNPEQRDAASREGPVLVLAGAGTGKTTMMTARCAWLAIVQGAKPDRILAVTFTRKAADELKARSGRQLSDARRRNPFGVRQGAVDANTFHAISLKLLRERPELAGLGPSFEVADETAALGILRALVAARPEAAEEIGASDVKSAAKELAEVVAAFKGEGMSPEDAAPLAGDDTLAPRTRWAATLYPLYQAALREANKADFADLLLWAVRAMAEREDVRAAWSGRWDHFLVDEYQDTTPIQHRWLKGLAGDGATLCVVGDDDQAIYGFAGADVSYILDFEQTYPGASVVKLTRNYRSTSTILAAANAVIGENRHRRGKDLAPRDGAASGEPVGLVEFSDPAREAAWVAKAVSGELERLPEAKRDSAFVLYRANWQSRLLEERIIDQGLDYRLQGDVGFYARAEVLDVLAYLELAHDGRARDAFERVANKPARGLGVASLKRILDAWDAAPGEDLVRFAVAVSEEFGLRKPARDGLDALCGALDAARADLAGGGRLALALERLGEKTGYEAMLEASHDPKDEERLGNVKALYEAALESSDVPSFLARAAKARRAARDDAPVTLMTLHASKGLEAPAVFLAGWTEGMFPTRKAIEAETSGLPHAIEEERRLAYVGITRARVRLTVTSPGEFNRFEAEIPAELKRHLGAPAAASPPAIGTDAGEGGDEEATLSIEEADAEVAEAILAAMDGAAGGGMPWHGIAAEPTNPLTGRTFSGTNVALLWAAATRFGYGTHFWAQESTWLKHGGEVIDAAQAAVIYMPVRDPSKRRRRTEMDGPVGSDPGETDVPVLEGFRPIRVFNRENVAGDRLPAAHPAPMPRAWQAGPVEAMLRAYLLSPRGPGLKHGGLMACYEPAPDLIRMPAAAGFKSMAGEPPEVAYQAVLAHECIHSTASKGRLGRLKGRWPPRSSPRYAREELVAELGAAFLMARHGVGTALRDDHAAYVGSWYAMIRDEPGSFARAAALASKAAAFILEVVAAQEAEAAE